MSKLLNFYGRFLIPFSRIGYALRGLPRRPVFAKLAGRAILITGATDGIGAAAARLAAQSGATVHAVGRSPEKLEALAREAAGEAGASGAIRTWTADLSSAAETLSLVDRLAAEGVRLDGLINNVGVLNHAYETTREGVEAMYAVNILNPYLMTEAMFDAGVLAPDATIANMASGGLYNAPQNLAFMEAEEARFNGFAAYATHKRAQIVLSDAWTAEREGVRAYTLHPGWVDTAGVKRSLPKFRKVLAGVLRTPEQGADTALWLIAERPDPVPGALWFDRKPRSAHAYAHTRTPQDSAEAVRAKLARDAEAARGRTAAETA